MANLNFGKVVSSLDNVGTSTRQDARNSPPESISFFAVMSDQRGAGTSRPEEGITLVKDKGNAERKKIDAAIALQDKIIAEQVNAEPKVVDKVKGSWAPTVVRTHKH